MSPTGIVTATDPSPVVLGADEARRLTDDIKSAVAFAWGLVEKAYFRRAWEPLGYSSWDDYCEHEFGTSHLRLPREERSEVVGSLRDAGLSMRAIAAGTGLSVGTVHRELTAGVQSGTPETTVTGVDGKTYPSKQPAADEKPGNDEQPGAAVNRSSMVSAPELTKAPEPPKAPTRKDRGAALVFVRRGALPLVKTPGLAPRLAAMWPTFSEKVLPSLLYVLNTITDPRDQRSYLSTFSRMERECHQIVGAMEALGWGSGYGHDHTDRGGQ